MIGIGDGNYILGCQLKNNDDNVPSSYIRAKGVLFVLDFLRRWYLKLNLLLVGSLFFLLDSLNIENLLLFELFLA